LNGEPVSRPTQTVPDGTGLFCKRIPGSKLPGYFHLVPPGRNPGQMIKRNVFEDEDDDEDERTRPSEQNGKPESHSPGASET
jgi:hypothetical protein